MMDNNLQYKAGDVVTLKVVRVSDMGAFLDASTGDTSDDILLHKLQQTTPVKVGDEVRVYLYLDPHRRLTASMKLPKMKEGQLGYAKVISVTRDGGFVDIGAERGVFLPYTEMLGRVNPNQKIWIKLYREVGDTVTGTIYNITKEGFFIFTNDRHIAFLHRSEADPKRYLAYGEQVTARITFIREDGHVDVSLRKQKENAMVDDAQMILDTLQSRNGRMPYCDDTPTEIIKTKFGISKAAFKRALGRLMKEGKVYQEDGWTILK